MTNPFARLDSFEGLRSAALNGDEAYERYRRREAAESRRQVARTVELQLATRVRRMVEVAIASSRAVLLVGPPGTGKTEILEQVLDTIDRDPQRFGFTSEGIEGSWVTPEEEWTFEKLVLGETVVNGELQSVEGDLLQALRLNQWLILDETNRADMDRVLGGVLTWLSGKKVRVGSRRELSGELIPVYLEWTDQPGCEVRDVLAPPSVEYVAGSEWRVLGTYNAVDAQRVFRMGQALSRRFKHVPVPPASSADFTRIIASHVSDESLLEWFQDRVTRLYAAHLNVMDAQLGPGLFVDIPAYVEHGIRMASSEGSQAAQDDSLEPAPSAEAPVVQVEASREVTAGEEADGDPSSGASTAVSVDAALLEELLAEAYLVSVGNVVAKYEPDILEDLASEVASSDALTQANWAWVKDALGAMRA